MKRIIKKIINSILNLARIQVISTTEYDYLNSKPNLQEILYLKEKYINLIEEYQSFLSKFVFQELPKSDRRTQLIAELLGTGVSEAFYITEFLRKSLELEGDICEFGVAQGATSALLANEIRETGKSLWLFDSFQGLPKPDEKDLLINDIFDLKSIDKYEGTMACPVDMVKSKLQDISFPFSRVKIVPGFIEETIQSSNLPDKVCFAYIDFDFYKPILTALEFLHTHLSIGGFIIVDDYNFFSSGVKTAIDEFLKKNPEEYEIIYPFEFAGNFCILNKKKIQ
jgi:cephalosporin hydroxylase